ncbi:hypothetical protein F0562_025446 [Nyssa sinensis]|uniref:Uncharacterized protein n=1 Tax=Nyssa sinensis TaxID=561372 RepID=A0A5J5BEA5_9ASTE|nr:hypothetical protein F0562_025446 [Nyssa sinensis]
MESKYKVHFVIPRLGKVVPESIEETAALDMGGRLPLQILLENVTKAREEAGTGRHCTRDTMEFLGGDGEEPLKCNPLAIIVLGEGSNQVSELKEKVLRKIRGVSVYLGIFGMAMKRNWRLNPVDRQ